MKISKRAARNLALLLISGILTPVQADDVHCAINWKRLGLTPQQSQHIQLLEAQWNSEYMGIQPGLVEDQRRLTRLLSDPKSDSLEIMALQQSIARKREQLRSAATANYLRKRQILSEGQQHALEDMIREAIAERQHVVVPGSQAEVMPDRIQSLIERVRNIWPHPDQ